jgi:hypothetical protein
VATGVEEVRVYPNPNNGNFFIEIPNAEETAYVKVLDIQGRAVLEKESAGSSQVQIHMQQVSAGVYFVEVKNGETLYRTKIVVE